MIIKCWVTTHEQTPKELTARGFAVSSFIKQFYIDDRHLNDFQRVVGCGNFLSAKLKMRQDIMQALIPTALWEIRKSNAKQCCGVHYKAIELYIT